jgi:hypothetical protein
MKILQNANIQNSTTQYAIIITTFKNMMNNRNKNIFDKNYFQYIALPKLEV